jgi:hypothetical protein
MYRRVVSLLLFPCLLLNQAAGLGHCHPSGQPMGHDLCPHFHTHLSLESFGCFGGHGHDPACHDDDDDDDAEAQPGPLSDHDADAVFVVAVAPLLAERGATGVEPAHPAVWYAIESGSFACSCDGRAAQLPYSFHGPPAGVSDCPLYLRQLVLQI